MTSMTANPDTQTLEADSSKESQVLLRQSDPLLLLPLHPVPLVGNPQSYTDRAWEQVAIRSTFVGRYSQTHNFNFQYASNFILAVKK